MKLSRFNRPYFYRDGMQRNISEIAPQVLDNELVKNVVGQPYPLPEICFFRWTTRAGNIGSYLLVDKSEAKYIFDKPVSSLNRSEILKSFKNRIPKGPSLEQRKNQHFTLIVEAKALDIVKRVSLKGVDMYGLTAQIVGYFVQTILKRPKQYGVLAPSQFLGVRHDLFETLGLEPIIH